MGNAAVDALDKIMELCGTPPWEYPGQVVRDVTQKIKELRDELEAEKEASEDLGVSIVELREARDKLRLAIERALGQTELATDAAEILRGALCETLGEGESQ